MHHQSLFRKAAALCIVFIAASLLTVSIVAAPDAAAPKTNNKKAGDKNNEQVVTMDLFTVTAKTRGLIPIPAIVRCKAFGRRIYTPAVIVQSSHPVYRLITQIQLGLSEGEQIISVDGEKLIGMTLTRCRELWNEGDPGRKVTLLVQGKGKDESVFRKVTVTTISVAKMRKIAEEVAAGVADAAKSAEE